MSLVQGLRFASLDFIELCITILKEVSLKQVVVNEKNKIEISSKILSLCDNRFQKEETNDVILKEKNENNEMINKSSNNFTTLPNDYENSSCIKCKYSKNVLSTMLVTFYI